MCETGLTGFLILAVHVLRGLGHRCDRGIQVHAVPGFVHFPHMRHIQVLGTGPESCANCHGEVNRMPQVYQVSTLRMGWCIRCHVARKVSRDCSVCHF